MVSRDERCPRGGARDEASWKKIRVGGLGSDEQRLDVYQLTLLKSSEGEFSGYPTWSQCNS